MTNYDFTNANINVVYNEVAEVYFFEISLSDFWNSITNEEYKQYIKEGIRENTVEGLNMYFHTGYNTLLINAVIEALGFEGTSTECRFEIVEDKEEETMNNYYSDINDLKAIVEEAISEADKDFENYDMNEIVDEVVEYDFDNGYSFNDSFYDGEEFWEIAEKYKLDKDYSEFSNSGLLDNLEEAILDDDEFMIEQYRTEILKRMK